MVRFRVTGQAMRVLVRSELRLHPLPLREHVERLEAWEALRAAVRQNRGPGVSWLVVMSPGAARQVLEVCRTLSGLYVASDDLVVRSDGRALLKVAVKVAAALEEGVL